MEARSQVTPKSPSPKASRISTMRFIMFGPASSKSLMQIPSSKTSLPFMINLYCVVWLSSLTTMNVGMK